MKSKFNANIAVIVRRSREGAWIEIAVAVKKYGAEKGRSREGAWIEI